jgi:hypothetical protein
LVSKPRLSNHVYRTSLLSIQAYKDIIENLPRGYNLNQVITNIFAGLKVYCHVNRPLSFASQAEQSESTLFAENINDDLYRVRSFISEESNTGRRTCILQSHYLIALICISATTGCNDWDTAAKVLLSHLSSFVTAVSPLWGNALIELISLLVYGESHNAEIWAEKFESLLEIAVQLSWLEWFQLKEGLWSFFLNDAACNGRLSHLWRLRVSGHSQASVVSLIT